MRSNRKLKFKTFLLNKATFNYPRSQIFYDTNKIKVPKIYPPV